MVGPCRHGLYGFPEQRVNLCEAGASFVEQDDTVDAVRPARHKCVASGEAAGVPRVPPAAAEISDTPSTSVVLLASLVLVGSNRLGKCEHRRDRLCREDRAVLWLVKCRGE